MAEFRVSINEVQKKAEELRELNSQLRTAVSDLDGVETELVGMWEGQARDSFHTAFSNDKGQMENFSNVIEMFTQTLEGIAAKYAQIEAANVDIASTRNYK